MFNDGWIHYREDDGLSEPLNIEEETLKIFREIPNLINHAQLQLHGMQTNHIPKSVPPHPQKHRLPIEINTLALILASPNR
jgi:hypothetical protein